MEFRKLISFGKTSYVLSLPKSWIVKNKLKKGDLISIEEKDMDIVLSARQEHEERISSKEIVIDLGEKNLKHDLQREITAAYINNFNTIIITGKGITEKTPVIRECFSKLIALEVVEQTATKIIAKDYLNMEKISIPESFKKMDMLTRSMMSDLRLIVSQDIYNSLFHRDDDVNRLSFLLYRAIKYALDDYSIAKKYGLSASDLMVYWNATSNIERIADNIKRVARNLQQIKNKKTVDMLLELALSSEKRYADTMKSFYTKSPELAYVIARTKTDILNNCKKIAEQNYDKGIVVDTIDKILQIISDTHDITRMVYLFLPRND